MRLRLLVICSIVFLPYNSARTWLPCMPFCDLQCTGVAAVDFTAETVAQYTQLSAELIANNPKSIDMGNALINQQATLFSDETELSKSRIRAFDGLTKKITAQLELSAVEQERRFDHLANQLYIIKKSLRVGDVAADNSSVQQSSELLTSNNALEAISQLLAAINKSQFRVKTANLVQHKLSEVTGNNNLANQRLSLIADIDKIDFSKANPFVADELDPELWEQYQKLLFLTFNFKAANETVTLSSRQKYLKRQMALSVVSQLLAENTIIPEDLNSELIPLANKRTITTKHALYETYRQHLLDEAVQLNVKSSSVRSLLVIYNIQLAQRNLLLSELNRLKQSKNALAALLLI